MEIVRIVVLVLVAVYLILAFAFMHISLGYKKQLKRSKDKLYSLFAGQLALFAMLDKELKLENKDFPNILQTLEEKDFTTINKYVSEKEREYQQIIEGVHEVTTSIAPIKKSVEENVTLIRNEVYRYNKIVDNINVNSDSVIFALFVVILRLKKLNKI